MHILHNFLDGGNNGHRNLLSQLFLKLHDHNIHTTVKYIIMYSSGFTARLLSAVPVNILTYCVTS